MSIERKSVKAEIKQVGDEGEFEAVIATLGVIDSDDDIIEPGAFGNATVAVLPAHHHGSVPLGKARMEDRGNLAVAVGMFNNEIQAAKEWHSALKFDLDHPPGIQEWSFAFDVTDSSFEEQGGRQIRRLKMMDVIEVSPVLRGAGVGTGTIMAKCKFAEQIEKALQQIEDIATRATEIESMVSKDNGRKPRSRKLSKTRRAELEALVEKMSGLVAVCKRLDDTVSGDDRDEIAIAWAALENSRRHLSEG